MGRGKKNGSYLDKLAILGSNLGLERIKSLLAALGNPQGELVTVHIAGSNGKGSTAAMVASAAADLSGESPHLPYELLSGAFSDQWQKFLRLI